MADKIFIYGTLKSSGVNFYLITPYLEKIVPGYVYGTMYDVKRFPAVEFGGKNKVYGEIATVKENKIKECLMTLDHLENYIPNNKNNMYNRVVVEAYDENGKKHIVNTYERGPLLKKYDLDVITNGVWKND
jgi:gamma-glutamylcyclotransferase (GGCT)/AIG2-like uncharacterized protein YtfP